MTRFIAIASGKGGVGKTTTAVNLAYAMQANDHDSIVLDANLSTPNVGLHLGLAKPKSTVHDVFDGKVHISDSVHFHNSGLKVIPADLSYERNSEYSLNIMENAFLDLVGHTNSVVVDTAAGVKGEALNTIRLCDDAIIVCNPELTSVIDARKTIKLCQDYGVKILGVVVTKYKGDNLDMNIKNIESVLEYPVISIVPEDNSIRESYFLKNPVNYSHPKSNAAQSYNLLANKIMGRFFQNGNI